MSEIIRHPVPNTVPTADKNRFQIVYARDVFGNYPAAGLRSLFVTEGCETLETAKLIAKHIENNSFHLTGVRHEPCLIYDNGDQVPLPY